MKIVLFFSDDANQRALAHRLAEHLPIAAIILRRPPPPRSTGGAALLARLVRGVLGLPLRRAWFAMLDHYDRSFPEFPVAPAIIVNDINDPAVHAAVAATAPDLVIVSGTNLLQRPLIALIGRSGKVMNLHTGLSPYVRGGPNCTNWCLATGRFELIGNTVMWIDEGIDSGNLIASERTPLDRSESLIGLHIKVMDHAHALLIRCARRLAAGEALPNVRQREVGTGKLYLSRDWNARAAAKAVLNFFLRYRTTTATADEPRLVSPETD